MVGSLHAVFSHQLLVQEAWTGGTHPKPRLECVGGILCVIEVVVYVV